MIENNSHIKDIHQVPFIFKCTIWQAFSNVGSHLFHIFTCLNVKIYTRNFAFDTFPFIFKVFPIQRKALDISPNGI